MTQYLTSREVLELQARLIADFGGATGVRDLGMLESALYRPKSGFYADIIQEAAALWESVSENHPFVDGNKRTALACAHLFLKRNGIELTASSEALLDFLPGAYETGTFSFETLEVWLRSDTRQV